MSDGLTSFDSYYPKSTWSGGCIEWYGEQGRYYPRGTLLPRCGDMIFFDWNHDKLGDHTGLVTGVEYDAEEDVYYILTIEGNIPGDRPSDRIRERRLRSDYADILGYGTFVP